MGDSAFNRYALTIVGGVVGAAVAGPGGALAGFSIGSTIGTLAGTLLFPPGQDIQGPRIDNAGIDTATVGVPIPIVYGAHRVAGNIIWVASGNGYNAGIREASNVEDIGGCGDGPTATTYSYSGTWAIGLCEGEIGGIRKVWMNKKLVYDSTPAGVISQAARIQELQEIFGRLTPHSTTATLGAAVNETIAASVAMVDTMEVYLGTEDQLPDPTIESFDGIGNVTGFRGTAYIVFSDIALAEYGNRIPNIEIEVVSAAAVNTLDAPLANKVLFPWVDSDPVLVEESAAPDGDDPRACLNDHVYTYDSVEYDSLEDALDVAETDMGRRSTNFVGYVPDQGGTNEKTNRSRFYVGEAAIPPADMIDLALKFNSELVNSGVYVYKTDFGGGTNLEVMIHVIDVLGLGSGDNFWLLFLNEDAGVVRLFLEEEGAPDDHDGYFGTYGGFNGYTFNDVRISVERTPRCPDSVCASRCSPPEPTLPDAPGYCVVDGRIYRNQGYGEITVASGFKVLQVYAETGSNVSKYPLGPVLRVGDPLDTETFWEAAYDAAVEAEVIASGLVYATDYPVTASTVCQRNESESEITLSTITLGDIVADQCARAGLLPIEYDVSELTELVHGFAVQGNFAPRGNIEPLQQYGFFDCVESEGKLKFPVRGRAETFALEYDDLAAHEEGGERPSALVTTRAQEQEMPRLVRVNFPNAERDYLQGQMPSQRHGNIVQARASLTIEVPVAMTPTKGLRIADVLLYEAWAGRKRLPFSVSQKHLALEPGDEGTVMGQRVRLISVDYAVPGVIRMDSLSSRADIYDSDATGISTDQNQQDIAVNGPTELVLLDLPALRDADDDAGFYAAARGPLDGWTGYALYRSTDGGSSFVEAGSGDTEATIGDTVGALASGPTTIWDDGNMLTVRLREGTLSSATDAAVLNGANAAAVGIDGRWEVLQFRTATLNGDGSYALTGLLRGRKGTEWAVGLHEGGDTFVYLNAGLQRIGSDISSIGQERVFRPATFNTPVANNDTLEFTPEGVALECYSPVHLKAVSDPLTGDVTFTWVRRTRIGGEWRDYVDVPLSEASERYELDITTTGSPGGVLIRTLSSTSQSVVYSRATITSDFGTSGTVNFSSEAYQLSEIVGRGYPSDALVFDAIGQFEPDSLANLVVWLDARELALTEGAAVATWDDQSGNGNDFTQGVSGDRPVYRGADAEIGGTPSVYFDNDFLSAASALIPSDGECCIAILLAPETDDGNRHALLGQFASGQAGRLLVIEHSAIPGVNSANKVETFINGVTTGAGAGGLPADLTFAPQDPLVITLNNRGGTEACTLRANGVLIDTFTLSSIYTGQATRLGSFFGDSSTTRMRGHVAQLIIYSNGLDDDNLGYLETYLMDLAGI